MSAQPSFNPLALLSDALRLARAGGWRGAALAAVVGGLGLLADVSFAPARETDSAAPILLASLASIPFYAAATAALTVIYTGAASPREGWLAAMKSWIAPLTILQIITLVAILAGFTLLIVPGLWLLAKWFVLTPALVLEREGWRSASRSSELTAEPRWRLVGALAVLSVALIALLIASAAAEPPAPVKYAMDLLLEAALLWIGPALSLACYQRLIALEAAQDPLKH